jgi:hypothetical protein
MAGAQFVPGFGSALTTFVIPVRTAKTGDNKGWGENGGDTKPTILVTLMQLLRS